MLQRLLQIKRARGDDHPEVATVLASLASAHSAMGAHESAERILRRVLSIRERTLAPNHFATLTTVEHLADACAARGKFEEALDLLHQALTMRERTLGVADPSIAAARARIADLELFASNETSSALPMWTPPASPQRQPARCRRRTTGRAGGGRRDPARARTWWRSNAPLDRTTRRGAGGRLGR